MIVCGLHYFRIRAAQRACHSQVRNAKAAIHSQVCNVVADIRSQVLNAGDKHCGVWGSPECRPLWRQPYAPPAEVIYPATNLVRAISRSMDRLGFASRLQCVFEGSTYSDVGYADSKQFSRRFDYFSLPQLSPCFLEIRCCGISTCGNSYPRGRGIVLFPL